MAAPVPHLSETVLKTSRFEVLLPWYQRMIGIEPFYLRRGEPDEPSWSGAHAIAFFRLHVDYPYTQVFGLFEVPAVGKHAEPTRGDPGLHHMQMRFGALGDLFDRYDQLKAAGTRPVRSFNHGPGTSFYYEDPDGNTVELSCVNFVKEADYLAYFATTAYRKNISGIAIDPDEYIARFRNGTPQEELVRL
jgi:catechol 2,3-dioxygenase-like lactoylglutathione lyase family enzyme